MKYLRPKRFSPLAMLLFLVLVAGCAQTPPVNIATTKGKLALPITSILPSPAPTDEPDPAVCLSGSWAMTNLRELVQAPDLQEQGDFRLTEFTGQAGYTFDSQGNMGIRFDRLYVLLSGEKDGLWMQVEQTVDGSATARYSLDQATSRLMLTDFSGEGISLSMDINGQRLVEGSFPAWRAFLSGGEGSLGKPTSLVEYAQVLVSCSGDRLTIQAVEPLPGPEIQLKRID